MAKPVVAATEASSAEPERVADDPFWELFDCVCDEWSLDFEELDESRDDWFEASDDLAESCDDGADSFEVPELSDEFAELFDVSAEFDPEELFELLSEPFEGADVEIVPSALMPA